MCPHSPKEGTKRRWKRGGNEGPLTGSALDDRSMAPKVLGFYACTEEPYGAFSNFYHHRFTMTLPDFCLERSVPKVCPSRILGNSDYAYQSRAYEG